MRLERPPVNREGELTARLAALESYLYRLVLELEVALENLEEKGENTLE